MGRNSRATRQKAIIQSCIDTKKGFFSADDLFEDVQKSDPAIGKATVYRYLKEQRKHSNLFSYVCDGRAVYSTKKRSHCHFICEKTGKVIHFDVDSLDFLKDKIPGEIESFQLEVRGVCTKCAK